MNKKDSLDSLLYQYAEKALDDKYESEIDHYLNKLEEENLSMDISFKEFWENRSKYENSPTIIRKKRKKLALTLVASLIFAVILIGPSRVATYADYIYNKIVTVFKEGTNINYKDDFSSKKFIVQKLNYIPEGFELVEENNIKEIPREYDAYYINKKTEKHISYIQRIVSKDSVTLDTEDAKTYEKKIDDKKAFIIEKGDFNTILVEYNNYIYLLDGNIPLEELEKMFISIFE
ncbi:DUF4367 domain-containing protein [Miniphocaeibacter halophilus]|uniref:DUF4367 domain-containing protein n=1 Tax=Miniphocaeibacter halophilus TaxID=2931922 RepID=A0AC61N2Z2_9FIRM|nr:DUF4367 domain-containing protein [Miniphocaeibacter halophilus]QQK08958.1 DUF4367 domain-containing protein [Miniphocaeibacter halophilus]